MQEIETRGGKISCCKGCGACCRQLVPISETEAQSIAELVESLPEPRRSQVKTRFEDAANRLAEAGLLEKLRQPERWYREGYRAFGLEYFRQAIPCPFLDDEACSIYPDRPVTCREFLVTTPAKYCQNPAHEPIRSVKLPMSVGPAAAKLGTPEDGSADAALGASGARARMDGSQSDAPPNRNGPDLLRELIRHLTGKESAPVEPGTYNGIIEARIARLREESAFSSMPLKAAVRTPPLQQQTTGNLLRILASSSGRTWP